MKRNVLYNTFVPLCEKLFQPLLPAPGMTGAFCSKPILSRPTSSHSQPVSAAATHRFAHTPCALDTRTTRNVSTAAVKAPTHNRLHTLGAPPAELHLTASHQEPVHSQADTAVDVAADSNSKDSSVPNRAAKRTYRRAKEGLKESSASTDLRCVNGVGPKNEALLLRNGLSSVDSLKEVYKVNHNSSTLALKAYLQDKIGIRKHHCTVIASDIKQKVDEETAEEGGASTSKASKRVTLCMEGNISAGKSTFLRWVASGNPELEEILEVVPEPVDKWQNIGKEHHNVLQAFYDSPDRYAYTFQNYVFVTRMMQERETQSGSRPFRLLERSVFSDRMVFVRAVHENRWMSDLELGIYDSWFEPVVSASPSLVPDGFIYLRAAPSICMSRMIKRQRSEETSVTLDYLHGLHDKHEQWLIPSQKELEELKDEESSEGSYADPNAFLGSIAASEYVYNGQNLPNAIQQQLRTATGTVHVRPVLVPDKIKGKVLYLSSKSRPGMPRSIEGVPTLILDYDTDIDMSKDVAAKEHYAGQVQAYFGFVKALRDKKAEDVRLSTFTGNLTKGDVAQATPAQIALVQKLMQQANMNGSAISDEDKAFLHRMLEMTIESSRGMLLAGAV